MEIYKVMAGLDMVTVYHISSLNKSSWFCLVYWTPYPYSWYVKPPPHLISNPLPLVYRTPYTWYIGPPVYGILKPLLME